MHIAYLDSDNDCIKHFEELNSTLQSPCTLSVFKTPLELLDYINNNKIDMIFSEADFEDGDIFHISDKLKREGRCPYIVIVSNSEKYVERAFEYQFFGYIKKPCTAEKIERAIKRYRGETGENVPQVYIKTFGRFDVFVNGKAVYFSNKKAKELLALLVDRCGGFVTTEQIIDVLWEDRVYDECTKSIYRITLKNLRETLKDAGCYDIITERRGQRCINVDKVGCDYYDFKNNPKEFSVLFNDEYMIDYTWSEYTLAQIVKIYEKN